MQTHKKEIIIQIKGGGGGTRETISKNKLVYLKIGAKLENEIKF